MTPMTRRLAALAAFALAVLAAGEAAAHIEITSHTTRHGKDYQKLAPCGLTDDTGPGETVYTYAPGDSIVLTWHEFIDHPGHYRVAFDDFGDDDFVDPATPADLYNSPTVMIDGIPDAPGVHDYQAQLDLPGDLECEVCTIQILQVMTDKPPFGDGNDLYYHCIDIRVVAEDPGDGDGDPGDGDGEPEPGDGDGEPEPGDGDGEPEPEPGETETGAPIDDAEDAGCSCTSAPARPGGGVAMLALTLLVRRRRPRARPL